jgi:hypothetical protein
MSQEIRRLHRRKTDFTNFSSNEPPYLTNPSNLTESSIQQDFDNASSLQPQIADSYSTASTDDLSAIRAELLEDDYHSTLAESDYWDDSHSWSNGDELLCDDYWHFLGRYE